LLAAEVKSAALAKPFFAVRFAPTAYNWVVVPVDVRLHGRSANNAERCGDHCRGGDQ
jgi:hypothetical protein